MADRDFEDEERSRFLAYEERRALAVRWICRILAVFAREACDLARSGTADWSLSRIEGRVNEVLRLLALEAEHSKFIGGDKPNLTEQGHVRKEVYAEIARSSEWTEYRDTLVDLLNRSAEVHQDTTPEREQTRETKTSRTGRNIDRLKRESGYSFDDLARETGLDKKLIMGHVNKGTHPRPSTLATYARIFTGRLGRAITVTEIEV